MVPSLSRGSIEGRPKFKGVRALAYVPDNASVVQPLSLTLEAFLSESIILDIISGMKLVPKPRERERTISKVPLKVAPEEEKSNRVHLRTWV